VDINSVAEELYSLPPEVFTATRTAREKEAKGLGDKNLAATIHQLGKPSTAAWLVNQLVRQHSDEVRPFLDLGAALREATAMLNGDQLRALGKQQHQLVYALMLQVRALASAAGHKVSQDTARGVEDTLHAALSDEGAADQLRAGRLTDALRRTGFPPTEVTNPAEPSPDSPTPHTAKNDSAEQWRADQARLAARDEQLARAASQEAADSQERAQAVAERAEGAVQEAATLVNKLRADLDKAEIEQSLRKKEHRKSQADLDNANRAVREASRRLEDAMQRRQRTSS
jgi:hypothetical protein